MKTLGLIGGSTWMATAEYYQIINEEVNRRLGGRHSARLILYSVDFADFTTPSDPQQWEPVARWLTGIACHLQEAGAEGLLLCANTFHMVADAIQEKIRIPLIHIADVTAKEIASTGIHHIGLIGTRPTMEEAFFKERLARYGISTMIPERTDREFIHSTIFSELGRGIFKEETRTRYLDIIATLRQSGAEGVIFGCTEFPLLISPATCPMPVFNTTQLHANAAVTFALQSEEGTHEKRFTHPKSS
jgi:aspartate racemase